MTAKDTFKTIDELAQALQGVGYFAERRLITAVFLSLKLERPLLLEGEPGVGKTELAKALAKILGRPLIRLQCYDGMEQREALYEWNHAAQLLHMRAAASQTGSNATPQDIEREVYQKRFLVKRPLLEALQTPAPGALLLIDEVDRADEPFEAFLLEYLGEYQVSIPELGTIKAEVSPVTILTSNRTRDLNDAVKRRCLYQWMDYPDRERELAVVRWQSLWVALEVSPSLALSSAHPALLKAWNGPKPWLPWTRSPLTPKWSKTLWAFCSSSAKTLRPSRHCSMICWRLRPSQAFNLKLGPSCF